MRRPWLAAGAAVVVGLLIAPVFDLRIGQSGVGSGVLTPIEVLVPADRAEAAVAAARNVPGVHTAVVGGTRGGSALVDVLPSAETVDSDGTAVVEAVRTAVQRSPVGRSASPGRAPRCRTTPVRSTTTSPTCCSSSR